jgi:hypothetical protein
MRQQAEHRCEWIGAWAAHKNKQQVDSRFKYGHLFVFDDYPNEFGGTRKTEFMSLHWKLQTFAFFRNLLAYAARLNELD